ncbi:MAG: hypothetical protein KAS32_30120 [Candidatus Peribacteraceae bacterium]|nr:hypothetical protein [Candidatus Peribacteraceae bacterium]
MSDKGIEFRVRVMNTMGYLITGLLIVFGVIYYMEKVYMPREISPAMFRHVMHMSHEEPTLRPYIINALDDDIVTRKEYNNIEKQFSKVQRNREKLKNAAKVNSFKRSLLINSTDKLRD